jgi:hypothetical protein
MLVIAASSFSPAHYQARWLSRHGAPLTDWFSIELPYPAFDLGQGQLTPLVEGGLLLSLGLRGEHVRLFRELQPADEEAPAWLRERPGARIAPIRAGRGYAAAASPRCAGGLEILTTSGGSCGCVEGPDLGPNTRVGPDGSLMVPRPEPVENRCVYRLYPALLR